MLNILTPYPNTALHRELRREGRIFDTNWEQANLDGFGDSNNSATNRSNATADFSCHLYVGMSNVVAGGELWEMQQECTYIPFIMRCP